METTKQNRKKRNGRKWSGRQRERRRGKQIEECKTHDCGGDFESVVNIYLFHRFSVLRERIIATDTGIRGRHQTRWCGRGHSDRRS